MLETDDREELRLRIAQRPCAVEIPRSLHERLSRRGPRAACEQERRQFTRFPYLTKTLLEVATTINCIPRERDECTVLTTDVSRDGIAFLHVSQLFPGELIGVWFPTGKLACRVMRCLKHAPRCFEIGAAFESGPQPQEWVRTLKSEQAAPLMKAEG
jgi:hypothetical protein